MTSEASYGMTRNLGAVGIEEAVERTTAALKTEGFGVLTDIDVQATLKKKIDVDFRPYRILGACNPPLAHHALSTEPLIGLLLPCNVVVMAEDDGTATVSIINPREMFKVADSTELAATAGEVEEKLARALASI